jgi:hypothetical protein
MKMAKVRGYETIEEAIQAVNSLHTRGVMYVLSHDRSVINKVASRSDAKKSVLTKQA